MPNYDPETYWSRVAEEIQKRGENYVAGDDDPYYRYKRRKFLKNFLDTIDFRSKTVLELGFGPGGNLKHIATRHVPGKIYGADVSPKMLEIATKNLSMHDASLVKIDGASLPYPDHTVDISFTVTVLQHNIDEKTFRSLVKELARVTKKTVVVMEDVRKNQMNTADWIGRPVDTYRSAFAECGYKLSSVRFLNTKISRSWFALRAEVHCPTNVGNGPSTQTSYVRSNVIFARLASSTNMSSRRLVIGIGSPMRYFTVGLIGSPS